MNDALSDVEKMLRMQIIMDELKAMGMKVDYCQQAGQEGEQRVIQITSGSGAFSANCYEILNVFRIGAKAGRRPRNNADELRRKIYPDLGRSAHEEANADIEAEATREVLDPDA